MEERVRRKARLRGGVKKTSHLFVQEFFFSRIISALQADMLTDCAAFTRVPEHICCECADKLAIGSVTPVVGLVSRSHTQLISLNHFTY